MVYSECSMCCVKRDTGKLIYPGAFCKKCWNKRRKTIEANRKANAKPGLVEVAYGVQDPPSNGWKNGGRGYAYWTDIKGLQPGDIVKVPGNWVNGSAQEATIISTYSNYDGNTAAIICLVRKRT